MTYTIELNDSEREMLAVALDNYHRKLRRERLSAKRFYYKAQQLSPKDPRFLHELQAELSTIQASLEACQQLMLKI